VLGVPTHFPNGRIAKTPFYKLKNDSKIIKT
jgi:hypothetical protein